MIRRGTTPTLALLVKDFDLTDSTVYVTIKQRSRMVTKSGEDVLMAYEAESGTLLSVRLTQEETLTYRDGDAEIQVRWIKDDGDAWATNIKTLNIHKVLLGEVIEYGG